MTDVFKCKKAGTQCCAPKSKVLEVVGGKAGNDTAPLPLPQPASSYQHYTTALAYTHTTPVGKDVMCTYGDQICLWLGLVLIKLSFKQTACDLYTKSKCSIPTNFVVLRLLIWLVYNLVIFNILGNSPVCFVSLLCFLILLYSQ